MYTYMLRCVNRDTFTFLLC